jgi:hypothetical protein
MFGWLFKRRLTKVVEGDLVDARNCLSMMKLKLYKEGDEAVVAYAEGFGRVAGLISQRFGISVPDALVARGLTWVQFDDMSRDLIAATQHTRDGLKSEVQSVRSCSHSHTAACVLMYHLYRLRFLAEHAPHQQRAEAGRISEQLAAYSRIMGEIAVGARSPSDAYN